MTDLLELLSIMPTRASGLSCVIPARNEKRKHWKCPDSLYRAPCDVETNLVEENSTDETWEELQRVNSTLQDRFRIRTLEQTGKGKADAIRLGCADASEPQLMILDADLEMPPARLRRFCGAYCDGFEDFINGLRLVYPFSK